MTKRSIIRGGSANNSNQVRRRKSWNKKSKGVLHLQNIKREAMKKLGAKYGAPDWKKNCKMVKRRHNSLLNRHGNLRRKATNINITKIPSSKRNTITKIQINHVNKMLKTSQKSRKKSRKKSSLNKVETRNNIQSRKRQNIENAGFDAVNNADEARAAPAAAAPAPSALNSVISGFSKLFMGERNNSNKSTKSNK